MQLYILTVDKDGGDYTYDETLGIYSTIELAQSATEIHAGRTGIEWQRGESDYNKHILYANGHENPYEIVTVELDALPQRENTQ